MKAEYLQHMGTDLTVVNAARVSFDKESEWIMNEQTHSTELSERDAKLVNYLSKHGHWTPFAHCLVSIRITVPFFVANQLKRHQIGFALNEVSRRYVDDEPEFFAPDEWRMRPDGSIKQGSGTPLQDQASASAILAKTEGQCRESYSKMLELGVAPEMARMVLPESTYTSWWWTGSLVAWARVCKQRLDAHAQSETREIAKQIDGIIRPLFPVSWRALMED